MQGSRQADTQNNSKIEDNFEPDVRCEMWDTKSQEEV